MLQEDLQASTPYEDSGIFRRSLGHTRRQRLSTLAEDPSEGERGRLLVGEGGGGQRRLLVVAGDFNFNSTSAGYRRLVEDGGLESAAGVASVEFANGRSGGSSSSGGSGGGGSSSSGSGSGSGGFDNGNGIDDGSGVGDGGGDDADGYAGGDADSRGNEDGTDDVDGSDDDDAPLDFVFFSLGPGAYFASYEVRREFSQERYADGYPSVTDFELSCHDTFYDSDSTF
ncbi:unnamed protein product [Laminaria digitata]